MHFYTRCDNDRRSVTEIWQVKVTDRLF